MVQVQSSSSALFTSCTLTKNTATSNGGVAYVVGTGASATFNTCTLTENTANVSYPVLYFFFLFLTNLSKRTSRQPDIIFLPSLFSPLPVLLFFFSLPLLSSSSFFCSQYGGVAYVQSSGSSAIFNSCTLTENSAAGDGGVAEVRGSGFASFTSCTLTKNTGTVSYNTLCFDKQSTTHYIYTADTLTSSFFLLLLYLCLFLSSSSSPLLFLSLLFCVHRRAGWYLLIKMVHPPSSLAVL